MVILARQSALVPSGSKSILYVDGFAGPGVYHAGEPGSPIVAIRTALDHKGTLPVPVRFLFIENDKARFESLKEQVDRLAPQMAQSTRIAAADCRLGDCTTVLSDLVARPDQLGGKFGPAMVFLDQFGYSQIPISLIGNIMRWESCEVLSYLEWRRLNHTLGDPDKGDGITRAFGSDEWREAVPLSGEQRRERLFKLYRDALKSKGNARYVLDFGMYGEHDTLLYWLFFSTNHLRGVEEMKKAMWHVDASGSFRFTDHDVPGQMLLMKGFDQRQLAGMISRHFLGKTATVLDVKEYTLTETPAYKFKEALKILEVEWGSVRPVNPAPRRRAGDFPDELLKLVFTTPKSKPHQQGGLFE